MVKVLELGVGIKNYSHKNLDSYLRFIIDYKMSTISFLNAGLLCDVEGTKLLSMCSLTD